MIYIKMTGFIVYNYMCFPNKFYQLKTNTQKPNQTNFGWQRSQFCHWNGPEQISFPQWFSNKLMHCCPLGNGFVFKQMILALQVDTMIASTSLIHWGIINLILLEKDPWKYCKINLIINFYFSVLYFFS